MSKKTKKPRAQHRASSYEKDILLACIPLTVMAFFLYGPRVLAMQIVAILTATVCDRLAAVLMKKQFDPSELGTVASAVVFTLLLPASARYYIVAFCVAAMALIGKYAFGGYDNKPFQPAALAYAIAAVSWPSDVFLYPQPHSWPSVFSGTGGALVQAPSALLKVNGLPQISFLKMFIGEYAGPMGATFTVVLLACFVFLAARGHLKTRISLTYLLTCAVFVLAFPRVSGVARLSILGYEILSGAVFFSAVFIVADSSTTPDNPLAQVLYGVVVGLLTMLCRYYGVYEMGVCFAVLLANSFSGYIEKAAAKISARVKPRESVQKPKAGEEVHSNGL